MTDRLYYTDAYLHQFTARVTRRADDGRRLYLDRSAFYPTSGGQPHDLGTIGGVAVVDVVDEGEEVAHLTTAAVAADEVLCDVDWARRLDFMQQHTGQHLISAVFADRFGFQTVSVHFGDNLSTLDLDTASVAPQQIRDAEAHANTLIAEARSVTISFEDAAEAAGLRKAPDRSGLLRIASIDGVDRSACGGTHVRSTAEIGVLLLRRQERVRKATRLEFTCGARAARRARADFEALSTMAQALSTAVDEIPALVALQLQQLKDAEHARRRLDGEVAAYRARECHAATSPDATGVRRYVTVIDSGALDDWRSFALAMSTLPRVLCAIGVRATRNVLVTASDDSGADAGAMVKAVTASHGGRGGGSPRLAQAAFPDDDSFARALSTLAT
jgi:alanyl-tRNA synthetase